MADWSAAVSSMVPSHLGCGDDWAFVANGIEASAKKIPRNFVRILMGVVRSEGRRGSQKLDSGMDDWVYGVGSQSAS
jgi:hypothetical protein